MKYCAFFHEYLYVDNNFGNICICPWMEPQAASIGSLITDDILEAYNSKYANQLRETMDDQSFKYCRLEACPYLQNDDLEEISAEEYERRKKKQYYPTEINMAYDFVCNQSCETCRPALSDPRVYNFGGDTIHEARLYPAQGGGMSFPCDKIPMGSCIILYGAGQIGREYMRQIEESQHCKVVLWIDKNACDECVSTPDCIADLDGGDYDFILLATSNPRYVEEMKKTLSELGAPSERVVAYGDIC